MLCNLDLVVKEISDLERKYALYFRDKDFGIRDSVRIVWTEPISLHFIDNRLPPNIINDIEEVFRVKVKKDDEMDEVLDDIRETVERSKILISNLNNILAKLKDTYSKRTDLSERTRSNLY